MIRVALPFHLRTLAGVHDEVTLTVEGRATLGSVLDALESRHPALRGTIRDHDTRQRRPFIRFFACERDFSHEPPETALPDPVARGIEPLLIVGAIAGGAPDDDPGASTARQLDAAVGFSKNTISSSSRRKV